MSGTGIKARQFMKKDPNEAASTLYWSLSDGAYRLDDSARQRCARYSPTGVLPERVLHTLIPTRDSRSRRKYVDQLVEVGLWIPAEDGETPGWRIPAADGHNSSSTKKP